MTPVEKTMLLETLRNASVQLRAYAGRQPPQDVWRLEALADTIDAERRMQGVKVRVPVVFSSIEEF